MRMWNTPDVKAPKLMKMTLLLTAPVLACAQHWTPQASHSTASLRGVAAVSDQVVWASGTGGTFLRTTDGGATWRPSIVPGAEALDFRGVQAVDGRTAWLMSSGAGDKSRIYRTTDGGEHWTLLFTNPDAKGFFDGIAFRDAKHGAIAGDPVDGQMTVLTTEDGGQNWVRQTSPEALAEEAAFAASNSCLALTGSSDMWLGTGGGGGSRVFHSADNGRSWKVATTPVRSDVPSAGIFSLAFADATHGVVVGGDYAKPSETRQNIAITSDGGVTWTAPNGPGPGGFRSAAVWLAQPRLWVVTGTSGSDFSADRGVTWKHFDDGAYNALGGFSGRLLWAVGPEGRIARLTLPDR